MQTQTPSYKGRKTLEYCLWKWAIGAVRLSDMLHEMDFRVVVKVGPIDIGLCIWSAAAHPARDHGDVVVYASTQTGKENQILVTELSSTDERFLFEEIKIPRPKAKWWHRRKYDKGRRQVLPNVEAALQNIHEWAEQRIGLSVTQRDQISAAVEAIKLRNQALLELARSPEQDFDARLLEAIDGSKQ